MPDVTLADIAQELGISVSTVSRVLNGSALIGPELTERIRSAAERMGYRKRRIRRQRGRAILTLVLVLPRRQASYLHLFYDLGDLAAGLHEGLAPTRAQLVLALEGEEHALFTHKKAGDIDGVVFAFTRPPRKTYRDLAARGIPCVTLNRVVRDGDYVCGDDAAGMDLLAAALANGLADPRPCFLSHAAVPDVAREREAGLAAACRARGIHFSDAAVRSVAAVEEIDADLLRDLVAAGYNAVVCVNDVVAVAVLDRARAAGIRIPGELAITGFDDAPLRRLPALRVDTVSLPVAELGRRAGAWARRRILERDEQPVRERVPAAYVAGDTIPVISTAITP